MSKPNHKTQKSPMNFAALPMKLAAVLFCLILITTAMMPGFYARYVASDANRDTARVALFDVLAASDDDEVVIDCAAGANDGTYTLTVTNQSEVAVRYDVIVTLSKALPAGVAATLDGKAGTASADGRTLSFMNVGELAVGADAAAHNLVFAVNWTEFTKDATGMTWSADLDFTARVQVVQID